MNDQRQVILHSAVISWKQDVNDTVTDMRHDVIESLLMMPNPAG